jgi:RING finger protein 113A
MASAELIKVPFFKKGKSRPTTSRKRESSPPLNAPTIPTASSSKTEVVLPSRKVAGNLLSTGSKRTASQRQQDASDEDEKDGPNVKYTASGSHVKAALDILAGDEAEELLAKRARKEKLDRGEEDEEVPDDGLYRGQKAYKSHLQKSKDVPKAMRVGPQRNTDNTIRTVTIVDYQPDVCKDYKGTFCFGFGIVTIY